MSEPRLQSRNTRSREDRLGKSTKCGKCGLKFTLANVGRRNGRLGDDAFGTNAVGKEDPADQAG